MHKILIAMIPVFLWVFMMARSSAETTIPVKQLEQEVREEAEAKLGTKIKTEPVNIRGPKIISVVSLLQLKKLEDKLIVIDSSDVEEYNYGHLDGAKNLPADIANAETLESLIPYKDSPVVVYCSSMTCPSALEVIGVALANGYTNLHYYKEGMEGWLENGFAVVTADGKRRFLS